jgi:hypothetical protein
MTADQKQLENLVAREEIRELVLLYSRAIDRNDMALVRDLYAEDATDTHGEFHFATVGEFISALDDALTVFRYTGHHVCNHLISVEGDEGQGEVYVLAYHSLPDGAGGWIERIVGVRYFDTYRKTQGRWRFAARVVRHDWETERPIPEPHAGAPAHADDPSYGLLPARVFARGARG